jgi:hypothetical protein
MKKREPDGKFLQAPLYQEGRSPSVPTLCQKRQDRYRRFQDEIGRNEDSEETYEDSHLGSEDSQQKKRTTERSFEDGNHRFEDGFSCTRAAYWINEDEIGVSEDR